MKALAIVLALLGSTAAADTLRIATGGHFPPYIYDPETEQARGFDKDLLDEICQRGDYDCVWVDLPMSDIFQALARGDVDVVTGGFGYSSERDAIVDFTCPYVYSGESAGHFVGASPEVDLITSRIGTLDESLYLKAMQQAQRDVRSYPTEAAALDALAAGEIDVVFGSHNMVTDAEGRGGFYEVGEYPTFSGGTVLGVSEDATALLADLNDLLAKISADGTLGQLQLRWLGRDSGDTISRCFDPTALA
ncbi:transporter substrate-binding domain-containing protein [Octadecabacter sp. 1_MG-2023]|uniref:substrate-binding periplasmic protein n=1 Tax=unclassified Octadecabacter TaxID=196158 RepID=UPI001C08BABE|nr:MULTISPECIES: transporter substrate-binding domain-containing protein [unclassified Octadecabacter]MBU2992845.1 transporter substrate-binding domain-containing protein [Octadecabacter sp. B2R22]MDO6733704.1 transporter substrate-binding domain-containing protein [Octadecabacter sp. 1_MG-2023]